jgi:hypothetical protein
MRTTLEKLRDKSYDTGYYAATLEKATLDPEQRAAYEQLSRVDITARNAAFAELERRLAAAERMAGVLWAFLTEFADNEWPEIEAGNAALAEWRAAHAT